MRIAKITLCILFISALTGCMGSSDGGPMLVSGTLLATGSLEDVEKDLFKAAAVADLTLSIHPKQTPSLLGYIHEDGGIILTVRLGERKPDFESEMFGFSVSNYSARTKGVRGWWDASEITDLPSQELDALARKTDIFFQHLSRSPHFQPKTYVTHRSCLSSFGSEGLEPCERRHRYKSLGSSVEP